MLRYCLVRDECVLLYIARGKVGVNAATKHLRMSIFSVRLNTCLTY